MLIKVCGITRLEDAEQAVALGATALGFVFWPGSPRFIDPYRARTIVAALPVGVTAVGMFVDQPAEYVNAVASLARLGAVQLHGDETPEYARAVGRPLLKGMSLDVAEQAAARWPARVTLLLDAHDPERRGGTGRTIDWARAAAVARGRRTVLAGGLTADNVADAIAQVRPFGVDVASGVESRPGIKDAEKLRGFFAAIRQATAGAARE